MIPDSDEAVLWEAIAATPETLPPREAYLAWLEKRNDPRAAYFGLRLMLLTAGLSREKREKQEAVIEADSEHLNAAWRKEVVLQDRLYAVSRRCRGETIPPVLRVLWREAVFNQSKFAEGTYLAVADMTGHQEVRLETDGELDYERREYLENGDEVAPAFERMFEEIDFVAADAGGALIGYWRHAPGVTLATAPVVYLGTDPADFILSAAKLQDFFLPSYPTNLLARRIGEFDDDQRESFSAVSAWFAKRGISTAKDLNEMRSAVAGLPDPDERFQSYVEG